MFINQLVEFVINFFKSIFPCVLGRIDPQSTFANSELNSSSENLEKSPIIVFREIHFTGELCQAKLRLVIAYIQDNVSTSDFSAIFIRKNIIYERGRAAVYSSWFINRWNGRIAL